MAEPKPRAADNWGGGEETGAICPGPHLARGPRWGPCHATSGPPSSAGDPAGQVNLLQMVPLCHKWSPLYHESHADYKRCVRMFPAYGTGQLQTLKLYSTCPVAGVHAYSAWPWNSKGP